MPIAANPDSGDILYLDKSGEWKPAQIAVNQDTNELRAFDGTSWSPVAVHSQAMAQRVQDEIRAIQSGMYKNKKQDTGYTGSIVPLRKDETGIHAAVPGIVSGIGSAIKDIATLPGRTMEAAASAPPGSRELTENLIPTSTETAALATPMSPAAKVASKASVASAPSADRLIESATEKYQHPALVGSYIKPSAVADLRQSIEKELTDNRFGKFRTERVHNYLNQIDEAVDSGKVNFDDFNAIRETFRDFNKGPEKAAAALVNNKMTEFIKNLPPEDVVFGDPKKAQEILQEAHSLYGAGKRSETITSAREEAVNRAARTGSGANLSNTLRQEIGRIARDKRQNKFFSKEELDQMHQIERGSNPGNITRLLGKFGLYHPITGWFPFIFSHMGTHKAIAAMGAILGHVSQKVSEGITQREIDALDEMVRARSILGDPEKTVKSKLQSVTDTATSPTAQRAGLFLGTSALQPPQ